MKVANRKRTFFFKYKEVDELCSADCHFSLGRGGEGEERHRQDIHIYTKHIYKRKLSTVFTAINLAFPGFPLLRDDWSNSATWLTILQKKTQDSSKSRRCLPVAAIMPLYRYRPDCPLYKRQRRRTSGIVEGLPFRDADFSLLTAYVHVDFSKLKIICLSNNKSTWRSQNHCRFSRQIIRRCLNDWMCKACANVQIWFYFWTSTSHVVSAFFFVLSL